LGGVGVGVGVGVADGVDGLEGPEDDPPPPQPAIATQRAKRGSTRIRLVTAQISFFVALAARETPRIGARIGRVKGDPGKAAAYNRLSAVAHRHASALQAVHARRPW
jgi:hypothetical protein